MRKGFFWGVFWSGASLLLGGNLFLWINPGNDISVTVMIAGFILVVIGSGGLRLCLPRYPRD